MGLAGEFAKALLDLFPARRSCYAEDFVIIFIIHVPALFLKRIVFLYGYLLPMLTFTWAGRSVSSPRVYPLRTSSTMVPSGLSLFSIASIASCTYGLNGSPTVGTGLSPSLCITSFIRQ